MNTLYSKLICDSTSEEFKRVVELGDGNSKTLGFLPQVAFEKYSKKRQIIGAFDSESNNLCGYLLYRVSYNTVTIVHLCIDKSIRKMNVAKFLVDYLKKNTKNYLGIKLSCRNDYGIDKVWQKFNFVPIKEKIGRSKKKLPLTIWWYPHYKNNLFSQNNDFLDIKKVNAVIDMNVFLDIKEGRDKESVSLQSDWLSEEVNLCYTREILTEINKAENSEIRKLNRSLLNYFEELPFKDEQEFLKILQELKQEFPLKNHNDKSDLNHLAYSILAGADFFITRDDAILKKKVFFKKYKLIVSRPSDLITYLDESTKSWKYKPKLLAGTSINSQRITADNIDKFISIFLEPNEKKSSLQKIIRDSLSEPDKNELITVSNKSQLLALVIKDKTEEGKLKVPVFRFLDTELKYTIVKHLIYNLVYTSINERRKLIYITETYIDNNIKRILKNSRFTFNDDCWVKMNLEGVYKYNELRNSLTGNDEQFIINSIEARHKDESKKALKYLYERYFYPVKISDYEIPTFIVPIKPNWAERLFLDKSNEKLDLFEPDYSILLNRENVYFRSAKPKIITAPSRVLWYVSENNKTGEKGAIVASSYIDEVFVDNDKKLFKQYERMGVYKWTDISKTSNTNSEIMVFVFSDTELFRNKISLKKVSDFFKDSLRKNFMPLTPIKIPSSSFSFFYNQGMGYYD